MHYRPEVTGNAPYTSGLAEALAAGGIEVAVVVSHPHYPEWKIREGYGRWHSREHLDGVDVVRLKHWVPSDPSPARRLLSEVSFGIRQLFARWRRPQTVLLISPALFSTAVAMVRARMTRARRVVWVQDIYSSGVRETGTGGGTVQRLIGHVEAWVMRSAHAVVVIHESFRRILIEDLGVDPDRVHVVRNWSHMERVPTRPREEVRRELGWTGKFIALHAGNQGVKQGLENVIDCARLAAAEESDVQVVLLGDGNQHRRLKELGEGISALQFMSAVSMEQFPSVLAAADVLLVNEKPGVAEMSVPSKLTSYFSTSRPVIGACAVRGAAASEIEASGGGVRVDAGNPQALLEAMVRLRDDPAAAEALGLAGLRYREEVLGAEGAIARFAAVLFAGNDSAS